MKVQRSEGHDHEHHAQQERGVANAIDDECFLPGVGGGLAQKVKSDQEIRAEAHALPAHEHHQVIVRQHQDQHGEHEKIEIAEEAVISAFMRHVSDGVNVNEKANAGHHQHHDAGERIELHSHVDVKVAQRPVRQMECPGGQPGVQMLEENVVVTIPEGPETEQSTPAPTERTSPAVPRKPRKRPCSTSGGRRKAGSQLRAAEKPELAKLIKHQSSKDMTPVGAVREPPLRLTISANQSHPRSPSLYCGRGR